MYAPRPPRPKKTSIVRTRTGCHTCRAQRRKCDEAKPECRRCVNRGVKCDGYAVRYSFLDSTSTAKRQVEAYEAKKSGTSTQQQVPKRKDEQGDENSSPESSSSAASSSSPPTDQNVGIEIKEEQFFGWTQSLPLSPGSAGSREDRFRSNESFQSNESTRYDSTTPDHRSPVVASALMTQRQRIAPRLPLEISTPHDERMECFFLSHYSTYLSTCLPPSYLQSIAHLSTHPTVRSAVLALAAANLADLHGIRFDGELVRRDMPSSYGYIRQGLKYYASAVQLLGQAWNPEEMDAEANLITSMLCNHFEWESGTARAAMTHLAGADALVISKHEIIASTDSGRSLLSAWADLHARREAHKVPFRPFEMEQKHSPHRDLAQRYANSSAQIFSLYSDSLLINRRIVLDRCWRLPGEDTVEALSKAHRWYFKASEQSMLPLNEPLTNRLSYKSTDELLEELASCRTRLTQWIANLDARDLPTEQPFSHSSKYAQDTVCLDDAGSYSPLYFRTSVATSNYIYYAAAQLQSSEELNQFPDDHNPDKPLQDQPLRQINPWAIVLLRVISGADLGQLATQQSYRYNFVKILFDISVCCSDSRVTKYIVNALLPRLENEVTIGKMMFMVGQYKTVLTALHQQLLKGIRTYQVDIIMSPDREAAFFLDPMTTVRFAIHGRMKNGPIFHKMFPI